MQFWPNTRSWLGCLLGGVLLSAGVGELSAQVVPGTGNLLNFDDLEDANWSYTPNYPKSSKEEDENIRYPLGFSSNRMWTESPKRGSPDTIRRCETPAGGLPGSTGSLYLRTRDTGIPGSPGGKQAQDDFILAARPVSVAYSPNYVVRVYLPEFDAWEQRQGVSFGIRTGLQGMMTKDKPVTGAKRFFRSGKTEKVTEMEPYYPGFFIAFFPKSADNPEPFAQVLLRSDHMGREIAGPKITKTGWWTFGMSVTPDSRCHYYARHGVGNMTAADHLYSSLPYNIRGEHFNTIFFNVCSADDGNTWSTPWILDDPKVYYSGPAVFQPQQQAQQTPPAKTVQVAPNGIPVQAVSQSKEVPPATPPMTIQADAAPLVPAPVVAPGPIPVLPLVPAKPVTHKPELPMDPGVPMTNAEPTAKPITAPRPVTVPPLSNLPAPAAPLVTPMPVSPALLSPTRLPLAPLIAPPVVEEPARLEPPATDDSLLPPIEEPAEAAPSQPAIAPALRKKVESGDQPALESMPKVKAPETALREPAPGEPKAELIRTSQSDPAVPAAVEPPLVAPDLVDDSTTIDPEPVPVPPQD